MKRILISAAILLGVGAFLVLAGGASNVPSGSTYKIELDNAFGLVNGADFKVAGVRAGTIKSIDLCSTDPKAKCRQSLDALVTVDVTQAGFGSFHTDAFCQSRPQSLIGEYFIDCSPGTNSAAQMPPGSTIPVTRTQSTIPADLVQNVMRMPYRERFTLIVNELGAAVAGRSSDLQAALQRAVPALTETDNLLNLLANDASTIRDLNVNADQVITALANNSTQVQRFIDMAGRTAADTAVQESNFQASWHKLPPFLEQLKPALAKLSAAADANEPTLVNLHQASGELRRFFHDLVPFSNASLPSLRSLGQASQTGISAVTAARPLVSHLNTFSQPTPELAQNLAIVLHDLDSRSRATEPDPRSPGGKGFTGLEAILQYVFNQSASINYFTEFGHMLGVDAFISPMCSPYANKDSVTSGLAQFGAAYRQCYAFGGPNQPGVNEVDPSAPNACVPDPGGEPPYAPKGAHPTGPLGTKCKASAAPAKDMTAKGKRSSYSAAKPTHAGKPRSAAGALGGITSGTGSVTKTAGNAINQIVSLLGGVTGGVTNTAGHVLSGATGSANQTQQLLNYLLAP